MHALKMQRALSNISYEKRGRIKQQIMDRDSFYNFDLLHVVKDSIAPQALGAMQDIRPTPIQRIAIPALLGMEQTTRPRRTGRIAREGKGMQQFLLAAETGSGKTLAYVLPVINAIKRAELAEQELQDRTSPKLSSDKPLGKNKLFDLTPPTANEPDADTARPRAIILVPTSELVEQVGALVKSLSHTVKFRSALLSSAYTGKMIRSRLFTTAGIDIVVTTPYLLQSITESDPNVLSRVTHLVVDEADSLLDRSFAPTTSGIIDRVSPSLEQLILCSATIPRSLDKFLQKRFPTITRLVTPNLHAIPRRVQLSVVDIDKIPYQGNRNLACAQVIWDIGKEGVHPEDEGEGGREKKILVFVNEREKSSELAQYLQSKGIDAVAFSRDSEERKQSDVLASFTGTQSSTSKAASRLPSPEENVSTAISPGDLMMPPTLPQPTANANAKVSAQSQRRRLANTTVLVTTDLGSRGIDTLPVRHVILYTPPHTTVDFIHRLGRVGRLGRRGRGVVLVGKGDRRDVVREVREGMFRGGALI
jgi:ATP-dependent RNA helicase MRH4